MEKINENLIVKNNIINMYNREKLEVTGVTEVLSSSEKEIITKVQNVVLVIFGSELRVIKLVPEDSFLSVSGKIDGLRYETKLNKKSFMSKVFK